MKISEIPDAAFNKKPTQIPTKVVPDWDALYDLIERVGYVVIECDAHELRTTSIGAEESPTVKAFNGWFHQKHKRCIRTKRIGKTRWFVTI